MNSKLKQSAVVLVTSMIVLSAVPAGLLVASELAAAAPSNDTTVDDFEDGDTTVNHANWTGWTGDTTALSTTTNAITGSYSGELTASGASNQVYATRSSNITAGQIGASFNVSSGTATADDKYYITVDSSTTTAIQVAFFMDGSIKYYSGGSWVETGGTWSTGTDYDVTFRSINWSSGTYDIYLNGNKVADAEFRSAVTGFDEVKHGLDTFTSGSSATVKVDDTGFSNAGTTASVKDISEDFEDGDAQNSPDSGWTNWYGDTGDWTATSGDSISGSYSGKLTANNAYRAVHVATAEGDYITPSSVEVTMSVSQQAGNDVDYTNFKALDSGTSKQLFVGALDDNGNVNVTDGPQPVTIGSWSAGTTHTFRFHSIDYSAKTYKVDYAGSTYGPFDFQNQDGQHIDKFTFQSRTTNSGINRYAVMDELQTTGVGLRDAISGTVVNQNGDPVSDATVEVYGINYSHPDISSSSDKDQIARDILTSYAEAVPDSWDSSFNLDSTFEEPGGNGKYVAVTSNGVDGKTWLSSGDLGDPQLRVPADEELVLTSWDSTKTGGVLGQNEWDEQLPGSSLKSESIVVEQIGAGGSVLSSETLSLDSKETEGTLDPSVLHYARADLNPGFYRVYPESNEASAYVVQVGSYEGAARASTSSKIKTNLTAEDGSLAETAKEPSKALEDDKMVLKSVKTDSNGEFSAQLPNNVETVAVQVIGSKPSIPNTSTTTSEPSDWFSVGGVEETRQLDETNLTSTSFVVSSAPRIVDVPKDGVEIEVYTLPTSPYEDISDQLNKSEWRDQLLSNLSMSNLPPALQDELGGADKEKLERLHNQMDNLTRENDALEARLQSILANQSGETNESIDLHLNTSSANRTELLTRIGALQHSIESLEKTIEPGEGESSTSGESVSYVQPFDTDLDSESVLVRAHYTNGTTRVLSTDSEYVSVNDRIGRGDEVVIEDLPLGEAAGAGIEVTVATEDGTGSSEKQFENPGYSDEFPALQSVSLSSVRPGPNETVSLNINPSGSAPFDKVEGVSVRAPDGSDRPASITGPNSVQFATNGSGIYSVRTVFSTPNGKNHTLVQRVRAGEASVDMPATVRVKTSPFGSMAVVGDGLSDGEVSLDQGGTALSVVAEVPQGKDAPGELKVDATDSSLPPDGTVSVRVVEGPARQSIGQHIETTVHLGGMSENTLVYRNDEPLTSDSKLGTIRRSAGQSTVKTHTDEQGTLTIRRNSDPSLVERASWFVETRIPDVSLFAGVDFEALGGASTVGGLGLVPIVGILAARKRRRV